jgi:hypothetical protein
MLETLRLEIARISLHLELEDLQTHQISYAGARQYPKVNKFIELKVKVTNLASTYFFHLYRLAWTFRCP